MPRTHAQIIGKWGGRVGVWGRGEGGAHFTCTNIYKWGGKVCAPIHMHKYINGEFREWVGGGWGSCPYTCTNI